MVLFSTAVVCLVIAVTSRYRVALCMPPTATLMAMVALAKTMAVRGDTV